MKSLVENVDFYFNKDGLMVLTESYLKERGYCCGNGCVHCPYNYEAVPDPPRTFLLHERNNSNSSQE